MVDGERHVLDGVDPLRLAAPESGAADGEAHGDAVGLDDALLRRHRPAELGRQRFRHEGTGSGCAGFAGCCNSAARKQATRRCSWPGSGSSRGCSRRQPSMTNGQRAAKLQPAGGRRRSGGAPRMDDEAVEDDVDAGRRAQQSGGVGVCRGGVEVGGGSVLDDLAGVHHGDAVADAGDDAEVVGDQQHADVEPALQVGEQIEDLRLDRDVEGGGRLVGDEQLGLARQGHRDQDALAHSARHLERVLLDALGWIGDADHVEQLDGPGPRRLAAELAMAAQHLDHLAADGEHRIERRHRVLEHHRDLATADAFDRRRSTRRVHERLALPAHVAADDAAGQLDHPEQRLRGDALARAGLADEAERLALADREADVAHGVDGASASDEIDLEVVDLEHRLSSSIVTAGRAERRRRSSPRTPTRRRSASRARPGRTRRAATTPGS